MYKNTHTQNKNSAKQKQNKKRTNKHPPPPKKKKKKKTFRVLIESVTGCKDSIPIFLFEEKKRGIWLSSMTHTVTQGATPVKWRADKHVTKLTGVTGQLVQQYGLCEPVYGSITCTQLLRAGGGRRGRREIGEKLGGGGGIGGSGNEENSARAAPKRGGGRQGVGDTSLQCISF